MKITNLILKQNIIGAKVDNNLKIKQFLPNNHLFIDFQ